jgi:predicted DCC family thiol-disulfide oxidoreductase YuxK
LDKIVFFDGECGLCNRVVDFFIRADTSKTLYFSSLQSPFAIHFFKEREINIQLDTMYFYHNRQIYDQSAAVKQLFLCLTGYRHLVGLLIGLAPKNFADDVYRKISKNRFKFFGKTTCRIPSKEEKMRFLEY